jgi:methionyl-tRNA formyltransferase
MSASVLFLGSADSPTYEYLRSIHDEIWAMSEPLDLEVLERRPPDWIVSHGYRHIVPPEAIARFRDRTVNLHISLLPWNRGADPNLWSFVEGTPSGVTIHYMDEGVDTGDVIAQRELRFDDDETLATTYEHLQSAIVELFEETWPLVLEGRAPRSPQIGPHSYHRLADRGRIASLLVNGWDTSVGSLRAGR